MPIESDNFMPWAIAATFALAGLVKGVVGLGLPTVAMGLLGLFMPPVQAAVLLLLPSLLTNAWQMLAGPALGASLRRLWPLLLAVVVGTLWAPVGLAGLDTRLAAVGLGAALLLYAALGLLAPRWSVPAPWRPWAGPLVGLLTGVVTAATGVFVLPAVPYLQGLGLKKEELVQALGLSFTVSTLALSGGLALDGALTLGAAGALSAGAALGLPLLAALLGMGLGQGLRGRLGEATFRRVFFAGLLLIALHLLLQGGRG